MVGQPRTDERIYSKSRTLASQERAQCKLLSALSKLALFWKLTDLPCLATQLGIIGALSVLQPLKRLKTEGDRENLKQL